MASLNQNLYLSQLPEGLRFTVTAVTPSVPDSSGWGAKFQNSFVSPNPIYHNHNQDRPSFEVSVSKNGGSIGVATLDGNHGIFNGRHGGKVEISFRVEGTTEMGGRPVRFDRKGFITVSSSDWHWFSRPDYSNISFCLDDDAPANVSLSVPATISGMPDHAYFGIRVGPGTDQMGIACSSSKELVDKILDHMISGIFAVHGKIVEVLKKQQTANSNSQKGSVVEKV
ncbi:hypothetical protein TWF173_004212 [Orbilia oligospora]|nr:hypothetical protein TWF173_004212 [Orbilia oligospora]